MYAIVEIGSSQFKVSEGDTIQLNRLGDEEGKKITLDKVLLFAKGSDIRVGQPYLKDVKVTAKVIEHVKSDKVIAFRFKRRKGIRVKTGHRQKMTAINITQITV